MSLISMMADETGTEQRLVDALNEQRTALIREQAAVTHLSLAAVYRRGAMDPARDMAEEWLTAERQDIKLRLESVDAALQTLLAYHDPYGGGE